MRCRLKKREGWCVGFGHELGGRPGHGHPHAFPGKENTWGKTGGMSVPVRRLIRMARPLKKWDVSILRLC